MSHDQPARLACRAPRALRLPCLHQPHTATYQGDPMTRRPTTAALTYRPDRLNAETLPTVLLDGVAHVPVTAVVTWLDAHAARWDRYATQVDTAPDDGRPYDLAEEDTRAATVVGAGAIADELTHRATDLTRLHAATTDEATPPVDEGVLAVRGLLHGLALSAPVYALGALTAWAITR